MSNENRVGALLLAAGYSRRFGNDKRLYIPPGFDTHLIEITAKLFASEFNLLMIALRPEDQEIRALVNALKAPIHLIEVIDANAGMGHSIAAAARELQSWNTARNTSWNTVPESLFIGLADMPYLQPETLARLHQQALIQGPDAIIQPRYQGRSGHPVGIGRNFFSELTQLRGDSGARSVLESHPQSIVYIDVQDDGIIRDIDYPII